MMERSVGFEFEFVEGCDDYDDAILDRIVSMQQASNKYFGPDVTRRREAKEHAYECIRRMVFELRSKEETDASNAACT